DERQREGRTYANLRFACGLPGVALPWPPPTAPPSGAWRRIGRRVPPSRTLPGHPRGWTARRRSSGPSWRPQLLARSRQKNARRRAVPCMAEPRRGLPGAWALRRPQALSSLALREGLTPPPALGADFAG